jgi:hypothetical protein
MNERQRKILIAVAALVGIMLIYPPFQVLGRGLGYSWIFSPPHYAATINAGQLFIQWVAVAFIGAIAFFLSKEPTIPIAVLSKSIEIDNLLSSDKLQESREQLLGNQLYEAIVGEKNRDRYLAVFNRFDSQESYLNAGWNWSAFLFSGLWALYRKMYVWFFAFWAIATISNIIEKAGSTGFSLLVLLIPAFAFGVYADALYYRRAKAKIASASQFNNPTEVLDQLRKNGGVHTWLLWIFGMLLVIGVIAAILIPLFART